MPGLDPQERQSLEQAQQAVQQAKADADKAWKAAHNCKPNPADARTAVSNALNAAKDAEEQGEKAKRLAQEFDEKLGESQRAAKKAEKQAIESMASAEVKKDRAAKELEDLENKLPAAQSELESAEAAVKKLQIPQSQADKLTRLRDEAAVLNGVLDQKLQAQKTALSEIDAAKKNFEEQTALGNQVRCKQSYVSYLWSGPPTTEGEKAAKELKEQKEKAQPAFDDAVTEAKRQFDSKQKEADDLKKILDDKQTNLNKAAEKAKQAKKELDQLQLDIQDKRKEAAELKTKATDAKKRLEDKSKDLAALEELKSLGKDAGEALQSAVGARQEALDLAVKQKLVDERLAADIESGDVFQNLTPEQKRALKAFDRGTFGGTAKKLAGELNGLSEAEFLQKMGQQQGANKSTKNTKKPGGGQQQMQKWEFPDGTVVRYKPEGDDYSGGAATYSIEVKSNRNAADQNLADVAFKVAPDGSAVPKAPANVNNPFPNNPERDAYRDKTMRQGHRSL